MWKIFTQNKNLFGKKDKDTNLTKFKVDNNVRITKYKSI